MKMTQQQVDKMIEEIYLVAQKYGVEFETDVQHKCLNLCFELYQQENNTWSVYEDEED